MREIIKELLMKYCDPKPEISGVMASDIAGRIEKAVLDALPSLGYVKKEEADRIHKEDIVRAGQNIRAMQEQERNRCIKAITNWLSLDVFGIDQALREIKGE